MKSRSVSAMLVLSLVMLSPFNISLADGIYLPQLTGLAESADQQAIIIRQGDMTTMTLSTGYNGDGGSFAWIIPVPGRIVESDVWEAGENGIEAFKYLDRCSAPSFFRSIRELRRAQGEKPSWSSLIRGYSVSKIVPEVIARFTTANYEIAILRAQDPDSLFDWLKENGFESPEKAREIFEHYITRDFSFVAAKLFPLEKRTYANDFPPPLTIRYKAEKAVFPLVISSLSDVERSHIVLYVVSDTTYSAENFNTKNLEYEEIIENLYDAESEIKSFVRQTAGEEGDNIVVTYKGELFTDYYRNIFDPLWPGEYPAMRLTRLELVMRPNRMTKDIYLIPDTQPEPFEVMIGAKNAEPPPQKLTTKEKVDALGGLIFLGGMVAGLIAIAANQP